jgi:hypothetical protein
LVDDPEPSQEPDVMVMDIINMYLLARFRVMVLGGVMLLACSTLVNAFKVGSCCVILAAGFLVVFWITVVMVKANDLLRKQTALKVM